MSDDLARLIETVLEAHCVLATTGKSSPTFNKCLACGVVKDRTSHHAVMVAEALLLAHVDTLGERDTEIGMLKQLVRDSHVDQRRLLDVVERLEAERDALSAENERLQAERDRYRSALVEVVMDAPRNPDSPESLTTRLDEARRVLSEGSA